MLTFDIPLEQIQTFLWIFVRITAMMLSMPLFDSRSLPVVLKAGLAFCLSLVLFPLISPDVSAAAAAGGDTALVVGMAKEAMLGAAIGLVVRAVFAGIQMAGQLAGYQMGLAIANVLDPATSDQVPLLSQFYNIMAMMIFVSVNAHYWFFSALLESFRLIPPYGFEPTGTFVAFLFRFGAQIFVIGLQIGAPVIAVLLLTSVSFGLVARTVPQMNIFVVAMPLKIMVGLMFLGLSLPYLTAYLTRLFGSTESLLMQLLKTAG